MPLREAESPYWNPRLETASRADLDALQVHRLRNVVAWADAQVPFWSRRFAAAGVGADDIKSLDDLRRLPMLTREEWMDAQAEEPPFGPLLAADRSAAIRYHTTSGTSGRVPLKVLDGVKDWEWISEMWCYGLWGFGVRPTDTVFFAFSYGTFVGFWGAHNASEKIGALVLPGGNMTTEARVRQIIDCEATVVCSTPTYAMRLAQEAEALGIDLPSSPVRRVVLSGEPAGSIPATKGLIEAQWGAKAGDTAGMTEVGTIVMFECEHQPGGAHVIEDHYIEEVVDPESGELVGYGELGERVVTSFGRGFMPVLRYRTRDLVVKMPGSTCTCGRGFDIYEGGIRGRVDSMRVVRGTNVYPTAIEAIVRERRRVDEFQIHLWTSEGIRDEIEVLIEIPDEDGGKEELIKDLRTALSEAHEGLRIGVSEVDRGTLPRFELKAQRLNDERRLVGATGERKAM